MVGIRPDTWQILWFDIVEPTDGSERYYTIKFRNDGTNWRAYHLNWEPDTGVLEGRVTRQKFEGPHDDLKFASVILPWKMTLAMAHRAGIIPECALNTKRHRPDYWLPVAKGQRIPHERPTDY